MRSHEKIRDEILLEALPDVPFDGWTVACLEKAALRAGYGREMVRAVFPQGVKDAVSCLSHWADDQMLSRLKKAKVQSLRVRDRIALGVRTRLEILTPYKEAERLALSYWVRPLRKFEGIKLVWKTADCIWDWAGDTATDYNRYTKRTLLSGIIMATTFFWIADRSQDGQKTWDFLDRRIDDVLVLGKIAGKFKKA